MSCNIDLIISSVVLNYLNKIDKSIGNIFQKKTNALTLAKGSPVITEIFNHYIKTNSKSKKIKFNAIVGDEDSSSDDNSDVGIIGDDVIKPIKVEENGSDDSASELENKNTKKSDPDKVAKNTFSTKTSVNETNQLIPPRGLETNVEEGLIHNYFLDTRGEQAAMDDVPENSTFDENNMGSSFNEYFGYGPNRDRFRSGKHGNSSRGYYKKANHFKNRKRDFYKKNSQKTAFKNNFKND